MFGTTRKKDICEKDTSNFSEEFPILPTCSLTGGFYNHSLALDKDKPIPQETFDFAKEIMQIMAERKIPYQTAMYLPDALHCLLEMSFCHRVFTSFVMPLPEDGDEQSDSRDDQGKN